MDVVKMNVVIANGAKVSSALQFPQGFYPTALVLPSITTSTEIIFQVSMDGVTYYPLYNLEGVRYSNTIIAGSATAIALEPSIFHPWNYFKVEVADAQTGDKTIGVVVTDIPGGGSGEKTSATLTISDIEIGAVELKNASDDTRAKVGVGSSAAVGDNAVYVSDATVKTALTDKSTFVKITDGTTTPTVEATGTKKALDVSITDGTNLMPTMDAVARKGLVGVTDGTTVVDVIATPKALKVGIVDSSGNQIVNFGGADVDDSAFAVATDKGTVSMGIVSNDNVDQGDKGALSMTLDRRLRVDSDSFGDGFATYSNRRGDFTATINNGTKTITLTGVPFTTEAGHVQRIVKVDSSGNRYDMPLTNVTVSSEVITLADMPSAGFVTGDTVSVLLVAATKTYDRALDIQKVVDQSPIWARYSADELVDTTNVATGTYYPSSTGTTMDGYKNLSLTGKLIDGAGETTTLTIEATNDEDTAAGDWVQVYGYDSKNNTNVNSFAVTNGTTTFTWDFDNFNYQYYRILITTTAATNTVIVKQRRTY